jgi:hypothetical protein
MHNTDRVIVTHIRADEERQQSMPEGDLSTWIANMYITNLDS